MRRRRSKKLLWGATLASAGGLDAEVPIVRTHDTSRTTRHARLTTKRNLGLAPLICHADDIAQTTRHAPHDTNDTSRPTSGVITTRELRQVYENGADSSNS